MSGEPVSMLELGKTRQVTKKRRRRVRRRRRRRRARATCPWSWRCWCQAGLAVLRSRSADFWPTCQGKNLKIFIYLLILIFTCIFSSVSPLWHLALQSWSALFDIFWPQCKHKTLPPPSYDPTPANRNPPSRSHRPGAMPLNIKNPTGCANKRWQNVSKHLSQISKQTVFSCDVL